MAENPKCWARSLGDCAGRITAEHLISASVWEVPDGMADTRENRLKRPLEVTMSDADGVLSRDITVAGHVAKILCERHNHMTSELDDEGRRLAVGFRGVFDTHMQRRWAEKLNWNRRSYRVSGPKLERWLLKEAINNLIGARLPIGSPDAASGWPSMALVEMVYGVQPVPRQLGAGLFLVDHEYNAGDRYCFNFIATHTHVTTCILSYGLFHIGVNLTARPPTERMFDQVPTLRGAKIRRPPLTMNTGRTNVEIRFRW